MFNRIKVDVIHLNGEFYVIIKNKRFTGITTTTVINPHKITLTKISNKKDIKINQPSKRLDVFIKNRDWYKIPVLDCTIYEDNYDIVSSNLHVVIVKESMVSQRSKIQIANIQFSYDFKSEKFVNKIIKIK